MKERPLRKVVFGDVFEKQSTGQKLVVVLNDCGVIHFHNNTSYPITVVDTAQFKYLGNQLSKSQA